MITERKRRRVVYIAGCYSVGDIDTNIAAARAAAIEVWRSGNVALCPHLNTAHFERDLSLPNKVYVDGDLLLLRACDAIVLLPGWEKSQGAVRELSLALTLEFDVYYWPNIPPGRPWKA